MAETILYRGILFQELLLILKLEMLYIDGFHFSHSLLNRGLCKLSACTKFTDSASSLKFSFEFLECFLNVISVFNLYDNHSSKSPPFY